MKINFVTFSHKLTGGTRVIMEVINALSERGHEVRLITFGKPEDLKWINLQAEVHYLRRSLLQKITGFLYRQAFGFQPWPEEETRKILKALAPTDINVGTISYSGFAVHRAESGVAFHYFMHYEPLVREDWGKKKIIEQAYYLPTAKIANSSWLAKQIKDHAGQDVAGLVFPAIDHAIFYPRFPKTTLTKSKKIRIVSLAKYKWWKGTPDALKAVQLVRDAGYDIEFQMFGNFDPKTLPAEVRNIDFTFVGSKKDNGLAEFYSQADILISTSFFESFPLPQLEAMACGTPVVTTKYGTEDYAFDHQNALVVEPKNPEQVAAAIIELIKNPELYKRFSEAGIKTAKNFTWQAAGLQLEKIFEKALAASKNG
jgi:glycosyltransferase involved in cell wall biosynthesis